MTDIERYTPSIGGRIAYEHLHRYAFAKDFVSDARVLDVACGEGYGAFVLASVAQHVVALDNNAECVADAQVRYGSDRLEFIHGDAAAIPAPDASFDIVVSFETIEHLPDAERFIAEIRRVLKPEGLLLISSPNETEYRKSSTVPNPFHLREFDVSTFDHILSGQFAYREMLGQRMFIGSSLAPLTRQRQSNDPAYRAFTSSPGGHESLTDLFPGITRLESPEYLLCFCSNAPIRHAAVMDSIFLRPDDDLWLEHRQVMRWASSVHIEMTAVQENLVNLHGELAAAHQKGATHQQQAQMVEEIRAALDAERASLRRMMEASQALVAQHEKMNESLLLREQEARARLAQAEQDASDRETIHRTGADRELAVLTPLLSRLKGESVTPSVPVLVDVLAMAWHERSVAEGDLEKLRARLADQAARHDALTASHTGMADQVGTLTAALDEAHAARAAGEEALQEVMRGLRAELADTSARHDALTASNAEMTDQVGALTVALDEAHAARATGEEALQEVVRGLRAELADTSARHDALTASNTEMADQVGALTVALDEAHAARATGEEALQQIVRGLRAELADTSARHDALTASNTEMTDQVGALTVALDEAHAARATGEDALQQVVRGLRAELADTSARHDALTASNAEMADQVGALTVTLDEAHAARATGEEALQEVVHGLRAELADTSARHDALTASNAEITDQVGALTVTLDEARAVQAIREEALQEVVHGLRAELADTSARHDALTASSAEMADQVGALTAALGEARVAQAAREEVFQQTVHGLRNRLADRDATASKLAAVMDARRRDSKAELSNLQAQLQHRETEAASLTKTIQDLAQRIAGQQPSLVNGAAPVSVSDGLAGMVDLIAYRDHLKKEILGSARAFRRIQASVPLAPVQAVLPVEQGDELCERLFFDEAYYTDSNPELIDGSIDPFRHYLEKGWREGRSPSALFNGDWYLAQHPQAFKAGINPLSHYVRHGAAAGLQPHPCFDRAYYIERYPDALRSTPDPFLHFVRQGLDLGNAPSARIAALTHGRPMIDILSIILEEDLHRPKEPADPRAWPASLNDYWLPQAMNDYISDEFGPEPIKALSYLFSLIAAFDDHPDAFEKSSDLQYLIKRCRRFKHKSRKSRPDVSIIVPVHNNLVYTLTSIVSILEHKTSLVYEIIVGDDRSTDATPRVIGALGQSVILVRHSTNLGFLQNCNACAQRADGRFLVFLNNDTLVLPGWLDNLIAPLQSNMNIGMTGSKLINGDGTLQEAGGIMWDDGSAWNYGRGADPRLPHFSYSKDVDYCSGASIAISRTLWDELGGFDTWFSPAYCEDSDLAFRVRAAGCRMWLAASSILIHHEGRSHGRDVDSGIKTYQVTNHAKLLDRWEETFTTELHPNAQNVFLARDRSTRKPHILIVDHYIPQWDRDAGSRTMLHFIRMFVQQGFQVTFWPDNLYHDRPYAKPLQDMGVEIIYGPQYIDGFKTWLQAAEEHLPYVFLSRPQVAEKYIDLIDRQKTKILYYGHDLHWKRIEKQLAVSPTDALREEMETIRRLEEQICLKSDVALYPSREEIEVLGQRLPHLTAAVLPAWYFDGSELEAMHVRTRGTMKRDREHLMFIGGFQHQPNVDGVLWFVSEVWPKIKAIFPETRLTLAGSNPPESIRSLVNLGQSITVIGHISDLALDQLYKQATLAIVPLRFGGGVKGKVIEAFSKTIPVVSTETGVQGIEGAEEICFVAGDAETFAESVIKCIAEPEIARDKIQRSIEFLSRNYAIHSLIGSLSPFVKELNRD